MKAIALIVTFAFGLGLGALGAAVRLSSNPADPGNAPGVATAAPAGAVAAGTSASRPCADEALLRRVVRDELMAAAAAGMAQDSPGAAAAVGAPAPASSAEQIEHINRRVDDHIRAGVISESEMARLQSEIATLDPAARRAAMQRLVRAMNSGALDGRL